MNLWFIDDKAYGERNVVTSIQKELEARGIVFPNLEGERWTVNMMNVDIRDRYAETCLKEAKEDREKFIAEKDGRGNTDGLPAPYFWNLCIEKERLYHEPSYFGTVLSRAYSITHSSEGS